jgi:hypothetical protein
MIGAIPPLPQYVFMAWCSVKAQGWLYLSPFTNLQAALDVNPYWQVICMLSIMFGIVQFQTLRAKNSWNYMIRVISKFRHHSAILTTFLTVMVTYSICWYIEMSDCQCHRLWCPEFISLTNRFPRAGSYCARDISAPFQTHTDWERFRSLTPELISPRVQNPVEKAGKSACDVTACISSAYILHEKSHFRK